MVDGRLDRLRGEPPLVLKAHRRADHLELMLIGAAASLIEGDRLEIALSISGTVPVVIRSVAAQLAHPCLDGGHTEQHIHVTALDGARVRWAVEPLIVAAAGDHRNRLDVELDATSRAVVHDIVYLGRSGEVHVDASLRAQMMVSVGGAPVLEDGLDTTLPGAHGPAGLGGHRVIGSVGAYGWTPPPQPGDMALSGGGVIRRSLGPDSLTATALEEHGCWWWRLVAPAEPDGSV